MRESSMDPSNCRTPLYATLTPTEVDELVAVITDPARADAGLSEAERQEYERCQRSVVDARRYAERHAHEWWIG